MSKLSAPALSLLDKYVGADFQPLYSTSVKVTDGEAAHGRASVHARSDGISLDIELRLPEALGDQGGGANPEQLFAAALGACFHGVLTLLAAKASIRLAGCAVDVSVAFGRDPVDGLYMLAAEVNIDMPGVPIAAAEELVRNAERVCLYAKMARHGIVCIVALAS
jgi:Ohr subfamily peroxiredoxin